MFEKSYSVLLALPLCLWIYSLQLLVWHVSCLSANNPPCSQSIAKKPTVTWRFNKRMKCISRWERREQTTTSNSVDLENIPVNPLFNWISYILSTFQAFHTYSLQMGCVHWCILRVLIVHFLIWLLQVICMECMKIWTSECRTHIFLDLLLIDFRTTQRQPTTVQ